MSTITIIFFFQNKTSNSLEAMAEQIFFMQSQEYEAMLKSSQKSLEHIEDVVEKYEKQVERHLENARGSMIVQKELMGRLNGHIRALEAETATFEEQVKDYKGKEIIKVSTTSQL
jgi:uncharacterized protein YbaP (TraB family)